MKNNVTTIAISLIIGVILGAGIYWIFGRCCKSTCTTEESAVIKPRSLLKEPAVIDTIVANKYYHTYLGAPIKIDTLVAFNITLEQLYAMNKILSADSLVHGFRIYMGADSIPSNSLMMVVGTGSGDHAGTVYSTSGTNSGPCPINCDKSSPITK